MKYYIIQNDWNLKFLESEDPFSIYIGEGMNLGYKLDNFSKITLNFKSKQIPDCIPNDNGIVVFNQKIISIFKEAGIDCIQYFDVDVKNIDGKVISDDYKSLNILKIIDAIDLESSDLAWSGGETGQGFIMGISDLRLKYQIANNELLFILKGGSYPLVLREDLVKAITDKGCTGVVFYEAEGYQA